MLVFDTRTRTLQAMDESDVVEISKRTISNELAHFPRRCRAQQPRATADQEPAVLLCRGEHCPGLKLGQCQRLFAQDMSAGAYRFYRWLHMEMRRSGVDYNVVV